MIAVVYLIHILGSTADDFFCPVLEAITVTLKMSPQLAGATFLVIGNGAADVFTQIAASLEGNSELGLGALMGAAIFVTCVVLARIHYIAKDMQGNGPVLLRDISFYLVAAVWVFAVTQDGYYHDLLKSIPHPSHATAVPRPLQEHPSPLPRDCGTSTASRASLTPPTRLRYLDRFKSIPHPSLATYLTGTLTSSRAS